MTLETRPKLPIIVGPTAVGKTSVALHLAKICRITIISADSRQVYRGLDIGTAKPTVEERRAVPHFGLDVADPGEKFSAGQFVEIAVRALRESGDRLPVIVGGTGLYIRALSEGLFQEPDMPASASSRFRAWARGGTDLERWAMRLDPLFSGGGRQRAERVVEVALLTGRPLSWWQRNHPGRPLIDPWFVRLTVPRSELHARIEQRVAKMLDDGWVDEVRSLREQGISAEAPGMDAVGYREIVQYLHGQIEFADLLPVIVRRTRQYAKRQETWFRHQLGLHRVLTVDATKPCNEIAGTVFEAWQREGE